MQKKANSGRLGREITSRSGRFRPAAEHLRALTRAVDATGNPFARIAIVDWMVATERWDRGAAEKLYDWVYG